MQVHQALIISFIAWIISSAEPFLAYPQLSQPLIHCAIVGIVMGNPAAGIIMGATLQLVFLGVMPIGGTLPPDDTLGSIIGTAFAISMGQGVEIALSFAIPVAMVGSIFKLGMFLLRGLFHPMVERFCATGNAKGLERLHIALAFLPEIPKMVILFIALVVGAGPAQRLIEIIPDIVIQGLRFAGGLMPAVGIALLMRMMWSKKLAVYFFLGVILVAYLGLPMISVVSLGIVLAVVLFLENWTRENKAVAPVGAGANAALEEELFDD